MLDTNRINATVQESATLQEIFLAEDLFLFT